MSCKKIYFVYNYTSQIQSPIISVPFFVARLCKVNENFKLIVQVQMFKSGGEIGKPGV